MGWIIMGIAVATGFITAIFLLFFRGKKRKKLMQAGLSGDYVALIEQNVPLYKYLPLEMKSELNGLVNVFLNEKEFQGCAGQQITDEVKMTIAAQACMLLLNRKTKFYPKLKTIYVYPDTYVAKDQNDNTQPRLGESWQNGPIVLAWNSVAGGAKNMHDGKNVVFHEFSHRLDQEDGSADGAPILENRSCYASWAKVLGSEFENLQKKALKRRRSVIGKYGATHPAEFFAVATEAFFEKPKQMHKKQPELYAELKSYYRTDPLAWITKKKH